MPQAATESPAVPLTIPMAANRPKSGATPAGCGFPSTPVGEGVSGPFRSIAVVRALVPRDFGHLDGMESALHRLHRGCLQYFIRLGPPSAIASVDTLIGYLPVLARHVTKNHGLRRFQHQFQHSV